MHRWKALGEVEKASRDKISQLIHTAEGIISDERLAWLSTINHGQDQDMKGRETKDKDDKKK